MSKRLTIIIFVILFAWNIILSIELSNNKNDSKKDTQIINNVVEGFSTDLTKVCDEVASSIVTIESGGSAASGFVYKKHDDTIYLLCANHSVDNPENTYAIFDNHLKFKTELVGKDEKSDVAVLKLTADFDVKTIDFSDSSTLKKGEFLLSFGSTSSSEYASVIFLSLMNDNELVVERTVVLQEEIVRYYQTLIQLTSGIESGMSGGPIINMNGDVVGMTLMTNNDSEILLALSSNELKLIANAIIENGRVNKIEFGLSGVSIKDLENYEKAVIGIDFDIIDGYYVNEVLLESFANEIGIVEGDIIVGINEQNIEDYEDVLKIQYQDANAFEFTIIRNGERLTLSGNYND